MRVESTIIIYAASPRGLRDVRLWVAPTVRQDFVVERDELKIKKAHSIRKVMTEYWRTLHPWKSDGSRPIDTGFREGLRFKRRPVPDDYRGLYRLARRFICWHSSDDRAADLYSAGRGFESFCQLQGAGNLLCPYSAVRHRGETALQ